MINVTKSFLPPIDEFIDYLDTIWLSKKLTNRGDLVLELEEKIQKHLASEAKPLAVCNGTIALQVAIKALQLRGEIITTPFSYVATTSTIVWEGCKPVFVDIDPDYLTIDETKIEAAITKDTSAILATHIYGNPCNVEEIERIANKYNLKVIYDASHCFGVKYKGKSIFDYGDVSTCSFHATKIFHTGEGGAIFCNNKHLFDKLFFYHNFGHDGPTEYHCIGINAKMSELNAAMGLSILKYCDKIISIRSKLCEAYNNILINIPVETLKIRPGTDWNFSYYPIIFKSEKELLEAKKKMEKNNIYSRRYFYPSLNTLPYVKNIEIKNSESICKRVLCLPLYKGLNLENILKITSNLQS